MNIELGLLHNGGVMLVSDTPLPNIVARVEYYREQRLFMVVYHHDDNDDTYHQEEMMHYELPKNMAASVEKNPNIIIYSLFPNHEPIGYKVPLVQVGDMY